MIPIAGTAYTNFKAPYYRANAIAALYGEYQPVGLPYYPWNGIVATLAVLTSIYIILLWLGLKAALLKSPTQLFRFRRVIGIGLTALSAIFFLGGLLYASISWYVFHDGIFGPGFGYDPLVSLAFALIFFLFNGFKIIRLTQEPTA